uniref:BED-type domain-containing protein n=1 Tax=Panagrellus redivivus TaxID=6233 RepID=A0A7E4WD16_PANRE
MSSSVALRGIADEMAATPPKRGMPKGKISAVYEHYEMTPLGKGKCRHCGTEFACPQAANLKKHLRSVHRAAFDEVEQHDEAIKAQRSHNHRPVASVTYAPLGPERHSVPSYSNMPYSVRPAPQKKKPEIKTGHPNFDLDEYLRTTFGHLGEAETDEPTNGNGKSNGWSDNGQDGGDSSGASVIVEDEIPRANENGNALIAELAQATASKLKKQPLMGGDRLSTRLDLLQKVVEQQALHIADVDARLAHLENSLKLLARGLPQYSD